MKPAASAPQPGCDGSLSHCHIDYQGADCFFNREQTAVGLVASVRRGVLQLFTLNSKDVANPFVDLDSRLIGAPIVAAANTTAG
jgi:hypothetical protein